MLTTKKFIKEVEKLGFVVRKIDDYVSIYDNGGILIAETYAFDRLIINTSRPHFILLPEDLKEALFNLLSEYASTPPDKREDPQKFYIKFDIKSSDSYHYLNYKEFLNSIEIHNKANNLNGYKTQFTQKEVDELRKKLGVTFINLKQIPVEEDEE